jgi:hypothetical protein
LYTNLIASRLVGFREQCVKAVIIYNDFSLPNALKAFIENNWNVHQAFRSVRIAFVAAGRQSLTPPTSATSDTMRSGAHRYVIQPDR